MVPNRDNAGSNLAKNRQYSDRSFAESREYTSGNAANGNVIVSLFLSVPRSGERQECKAKGVVTGVVIERLHIVKL